MLNNPFLGNRPPSPYEADPDYMPPASFNDEDYMSCLLRKEHSPEEERELFRDRAEAIRTVLDKVLRLPSLPQNTRELLKIFYLNPSDTAPLFGTSVLRLPDRAIAVKNEGEPSLLTQLEHVDPANPEISAALNKTWHFLVQQSAFLQEGRDHLPEQRLNSRMKQSPIADRAEARSSGVRQTRRPDYHVEEMPDLPALKNIQRGVY